MKKSVVFLINGLGIEKPGSYSISIDQCMPNLARTKETSFYTSAITSSLEYKSAYQRFFLGDTYSMELKYIKNNILNENIKLNSIYQSFSNKVGIPSSKLHVFLEPTNDKIVEQINALINTLSLENNKQVYLHLILSQQTISEYKNLISITNYIKYHINSHITVGFVIGKEYLSDNLTQEELIEMRKLFFYCSAERWTETDKKFLDLESSNIRPCLVPGFCATNDCTITKEDTILFFNTRKSNYDNFINAIITNATEVFKTDTPSLYFYSLIQLYSKYNISYFCDKIIYENSLANLLGRNQKKALIITDEANINLINFDANGLTSMNNPDIAFMKNDATLYDKNVIYNIIDNSIYDLIIFDNHMDVSKTINDLKNQLEHLDKIVGNISEACVNKHSLFITSLYGVKKELPIASYNTEMVTIDYEMQIPIFFFDYSYPRSRFMLMPGDTNDILLSALKCICDDPLLDTLIRPKGLLNNLILSFKEKKK